MNLLTVTQNAELYNGAISHKIVALLSRYKSLRALIRVFFLFLPISIEEACSNNDFQV